MKAPPITSLGTYLIADKRFTDRHWHGAHSKSCPTDPSCRESGYLRFPLNAGGVASIGDL